METKPEGNWMENIPKEETVAILVPLYGYWKDAKIKQFTLNSLTYALNNLHTNKLKSYIIFIGESDRIPSNIQHFFIANYSAGNVKGAHVDRDSSYAQYLEEGIDTALNETDAKFIVVVNPC